MEPTYEGLKQERSIPSFHRPPDEFGAYLWGIETPLLSGLFWALCSKFGAYLWGIETGIAHRCHAP